MPAIRASTDLQEAVIGNSADHGGSRLPGSQGWPQCLHRDSALPTIATCWPAGREGPCRLGCDALDGRDLVAHGRRVEPGHSAMTMRTPLLLEAWSVMSSMGSPESLACGGWASGQERCLTREMIACPASGLEVLAGSDSMTRHAVNSKPVVRTWFIDERRSQVQQLAGTGSGLAVRCDLHRVHVRNGPDSGRTHTKGDQRPFRSCLLSGLFMHIPGCRRCWGNVRTAPTRAAKTTIRKAITIERVVAMGALMGDARRSCCPDLRRLLGNDRETEPD